jgi:hypothetical protein
MSKYYVYEYRHPLTNVPFYVGKGTGTKLKKIQKITKSGHTYKD